jgi:hypothetical protein
LQACSFKHRGAELTKHSGREPNATRDEQRLNGPGKRRPRPDEPPVHERRSSSRVRDEQQSGHGSLTALSKLKMLERKRAAIRPARDEPARILD